MKLGYISFEDKATLIVMLFIVLLLIVNLDNFNFVETIAQPIENSPWLWVS